MPIQTIDLPSLDFIAGLITGAGAFMWIKQNNQEIPVFQLKMHADEKPLFEATVKKMGLKEQIYEYTHQNRHYVLLLVRSRKSIEDTIIPAFDQRLLGLKKAQFEKWKKKYYEKKLDFIYKKR